MNRQTFSPHSITENSHPQFILNTFVFSCKNFNNKLGCNQIQEKCIFDVTVRFSNLSLRKKNLWAHFKEFRLSVAFDFNLKHCLTRKLECCTLKESLKRMFEWLKQKIDVFILGKYFQLLTLLHKVIGKKSTGIWNKNLMKIVLH